MSMARKAASRAGKRKRTRKPAALPVGAAGALIGSVLSAQLARLALTEADRRQGKRDKRDAKALKEAGSKKEMDKARARRDKGKSIEKQQKQAWARFKRGKMS